MPQFDTHFLTSLLFWSLVSFAILFLFLYRYGVPVIMGQLEAREKKIKDSLENAERLQKEAQAIMAEYENRIKNAKQEAEAILERARIRGQQMIEEGEKRARQDSERMLASTRQEMEREKIKLMKEVRQATADLVISTTEKIIQKSLNKADHERLIDDAIELAARNYRPHS